MSAFFHERVTFVHHWTDRLFSFRTSRNPHFRFEAGQFIMLGLEIKGRNLLRAYSIASAAYDEQLEFFSIKVPEGPLTSLLQNVKIGDPILIGRKPTGTLLLSHLASGRTLYLIATGTGLAPFLSLIQDPATYDAFDRVILLHGVRYRSDLAYQAFIALDLPNHPLLGEEIRKKLIYLPCVSREASEFQGRTIDFLKSEAFYEKLALDKINPVTDRAMLCGSPAMIADAKLWLTSIGFNEGSSGAPGSFVIEKAFVER